MLHVAADVISFAATFYTSHLSLILSRLLSKPDPLRWAPVWFWVQTLKLQHLYCFDSPEEKPRAATALGYFHVFFRAVFPLQVQDVLYVALHPGRALLFHLVSTAVIYLRFSYSWSRQYRGSPVR